MVPSGPNRGSRGFATGKLREPKPQTDVFLFAGQSERSSPNRKLHLSVRVPSWGEWAQVQLFVASEYAMSLVQGVRDHCYGSRDLEDAYTDI